MPPRPPNINTTTGSITQAGHRDGALASSASTRTRTTGQGGGSSFMIFSNSQHDTQVTVTQPAQAFTGRSLTGIQTAGSLLPVAPVARSNLTHHGHAGGPPQATSSTSNNPSSTTGATANQIVAATNPNLNLHEHHVVGISDATDISAGHCLEIGLTTQPQIANGAESRRLWPDLREGIDEGGLTTASGRLKRNREDELDPDDSDTPKSYKDAPEFPFKQAAAHIRRAFDLYGNIHAIVNDGIKRSAKEDAGENSANIQLDRDFESYKLIMNHIRGLYEEIIRLHNQPLEFRRLIRKVKKYADNARNNDNAGLKKDIQFFLTDEGDSILKSIKPGMKVSTKSDRGFTNDVMGRYLCPMNLNWDDLEIRQKIRDGKIAITAKQFPLLLFANCTCNIDDMEEGLGRNKALLRTVKFIFTGRSSAFSTTAGGRTTRASNALIAGCSSITPRIIAYGACMLRFSLSAQESWVTLDGEFDMREFYWKVVGLFDNSGEFGENLLAWWNKEVFGTSIVLDTAMVENEDCSLSLLQAQREAKRRRTLVDRDINSDYTY